MVYIFYNQDYKKQIMIYYDLEYFTKFWDKYELEFDETLFLTKTVDILIIIFTTLALLNFGLQLLSIGRLVNFLTQNKLI